MRIGIDFDNTIVNYDGVFFDTAENLGWLQGGIGHSKNEVKQFFISRDQEPLWTELQGIVYGETITSALPYEGVQDALSALKSAGAELFLVSHKTRYPIIGKKRDFHQAARRWLDDNGIGELFSDKFFCPEKDEKVARIAALQLAWFVDDLPSILQHQDFPSSTLPILFDPDRHHTASLPVANRWQDIVRMIGVRVE